MGITNNLFLFLLLISSVLAQAEIVVWGTSDSYRKNRNISGSAANKAQLTTEKRPSSQQVIKSNLRKTPRKPNGTLLAQIKERRANSANLISSTRLLSEFSNILLETRDEYTTAYDTSVAYLVADSKGKFRVIYWVNSEIGYVHPQSHSLLECDNRLYSGDAYYHRVEILDCVAVGDVQDLRYYTYYNGQPIADSSGAYYADGEVLYDYFYNDMYWPNGQTLVNNYYSYYSLGNTDDDWSDFYWSYGEDMNNTISLFYPDGGYLYDFGDLYFENGIKYFDNNWGLKYIDNGTLSSSPDISTGSLRNLYYPNTTKIREYPSSTNLYRTFYFGGTKILKDEINPQFGYVYNESGFKVSYVEKSYLLDSYNLYWPTDVFLDVTEVSHYIEIAQKETNTNFSAAFMKDRPPLPQPPTNFNATSVAETAITMGWGAGDSNTYGYYLLWGTTSSLADCASQGVDIGNVRSKTFTNLQVNTTYYFKICAYNGARDVSNSVTRAVKTLSGIPKAPINLNVAEERVSGLQPTSSLNYTWDTESLITSSYRVAWSQGTNPPSCANGQSVSAKNFKINNLVPNTQYAFSVCAVSIYGLVSTATAKVTKTSPALCPADCNNDGATVASEALIALKIAVGSLPYAQCPSADVNKDGKVTAGEAQLALKAAVGSVCQK